MFSNFRATFLSKIFCISILLRKSRCSWLSFRSKLNGMSWSDLPRFKSEYQIHFLLPRKMNTFVQNPQNEEL
jgi:hypothetical protein